MVCSGKSLVTHISSHKGAFVVLPEWQTVYARSGAIACSLPHCHAAYWLMCGRPTSRHHGHDLARTVACSHVDTNRHCARRGSGRSRAAGSQSFQHNRIIDGSHSPLVETIRTYELRVGGELTIEGAFSKTSLERPVGINYASCRCHSCCLQEGRSAIAARAALHL